MDKIIAYMFGVMFGIACLCFLVVLGPIVGAVSGWFVGLFFGDTILGIFAALGLHGFTMSQIGAFLGFLGGLFHSISLVKASK